MAKAAVPEIHRTEYKLSLQLEHWTTCFDPDEVKLLLAESLNACIVQQGHEQKTAIRLSVEAYLITYRHLFLVLSCPKGRLAECMRRFKEHIKIRLITWPYKNGQQPPGEELLGELFKMHPLHNQVLLRLICGKKPSNESFDPQVTRLEHYIHSHNYCSAMDYAGRNGPVILSWQEADLLHGKLFYLKN
jgi:hypothetical protein